jgi:hypothetical protein
MIYSSHDVQTLGICQPRFNLFQRVYVHSKDEDDSDVFEGSGIICGLLIECSERYPTNQFFIDGWWYDVLLYDLPSGQSAALPIREWVHESELRGIAIAS